MRQITLALAVVTGLGAMTCSAQNALESMQGSIKIDGSSTVYPITEAVAEEFAEIAPRIRVTVGISGTGGGFKRFAVGETDISNASRPIKDKELASTKDNGVEFIEVPVAYDGLSIVVNTSNYWVDHLTVDELRRIFLDGSPVRTWQDVRSDWPPTPIKLYAPGTDSGTFDYFKEVVAGKNGAIRSDMSVSEDDNVLVRGVSGDEGGIGFFGCAYYFENKDKLKVVPIVSPTTLKPVTPSAQTIEGGSYEPFSRPLFIYVNKQSLTKPQVKAFCEFYLSKGPALAEEVGYVKLPAFVYAKARQNLMQGVTGTHFLDKDGNKVKKQVTELFK